MLEEFRQHVRRRLHARRGVRPLRTRAAPADRRAERPVPPALLHGSDGACRTRPRCTCSRSTRICSSSSTTGTGAWASSTRRSAACRAADGAARPPGRVLRRQGRRRQDHLLGGVRAGGQPAGAAGCCSSRPIRPIRPPTSSSVRSARRSASSTPSLSALEIDGDAEAARYIADVKRDIRADVQPQRASSRRTARSRWPRPRPGCMEVALLDRMIDLIVDRGRDFDLIVFDTAPTGHTLQLLRMPDAMTTWIQALVKHRRARARDRPRRRTDAG